MIMIVIIMNAGISILQFLNHPDIPSENKQTRYFDMEISTTKNCIYTLRDSGQILESQKKKKKSREFKHFSQVQNLLCQQVPV